MNLLIRITTKNDIRINIVNQLFKAFSYIHRKGYLHRDISLTNILLKKYDDIMIDNAKIKMQEIAKIKMSEKLQNYLIIISKK